MDDKLHSEKTDSNLETKVIVLFGGSPVRRQEVTQLLSSLKLVTIIGTLSEEEGMSKLKELPKVDLVLIGGRYSDEQRVRIRNYILTQMPNTYITEPGHDYPYSNDAILSNVKPKLGL